MRNACRSVTLASASQCDGPCSAGLLSLGPSAKSVGELVHWEVRECMLPRESSSILGLIPVRFRHGLFPLSDG